MTPLAEDLDEAKDKSSPRNPADSKVPLDDNLADDSGKQVESTGTAQSDEKPAAQSPIIESLPPIQTTTHEVTTENYGVVVTDTNFNVGSVEVNTFHIEDQLPAPQSDVADPSSAESNSGEVTDGKNESAPGVVVPSGPEKEIQDGEIQDGEIDEIAGAEVPVNNSIAPQEKTDVAEGTDTSSEPEYKLASEPIDSKADVAVADIKETAPDRDRSASVSDSDIAESKEPATLAPDSREQKKAVAKQLSFDPGKVNPENRLKLHYANENAWFADAMFFIWSAEFVLRWLVIGLLTGLGLSLIVGAFSAVSFLGYLVALPGLILLAVAGADIMCETLSGCKRIEKWTSWEVEKILSQSLVVVLSFAFAVIPGILISLPFILSIENYVLTSVLASISFLLLFPAFAMSILDNQAISQPFSARVFGSIRNKWMEWLRFWGLSLVCLLFVLGFGFFSMFGGGFLFCLVETLGIGFVALSYFRFIGFQFRKLFFADEKAASGKKTTSDAKKSENA